MVKKYNQFIKELNTTDEDAFNYDEMDSDADIEETMIDGGVDVLAVKDEEDKIQQEEEEGLDVYLSKLQELADKLEVEVVDGKVEYKGKEIIFPSETNKYHVDRKKFNTPEEVISYLGNL